MRTQQRLVRIGVWCLVGGALQLLSPALPAGLAEEPGQSGPTIALGETYNAVTKIYFTNTAKHSGSPKPDPVKRRFRADLKYWLMDSTYYDRGQLSIGNPELVEFVRRVGSKDRPASEPTTLSAMAYGIARAALERYPAMQKVEVHLVHFSKGLTAKEETEDNHVVHIVLTR